MWETWGFGSMAIKKNFIQTEVDYIFFFFSFWGKTNIEAISFPFSERAGSGCMHYTKKVNKNERKANMEGEGDRVT